VTAVIVPVPACGLNPDSHGPPLSPAVIRQVVRTLPGLVALGTAWPAQ
jgi:hypothetical protein